MVARLRVRGAIQTRLAVARVPAVRGRRRFSWGIEASGFVQTMNESAGTIICENYL
jgi:hypothetical protein